MIVEFLGLPGSGKSYIANKEFGYEEKSFTSIQARMVKYFLAALYEILHPIRSARFFFVTVKETKDNSALLKHKLKFLYLNAEAREMAVVFKKQKVIEEGLIMYLLSVYERAISKDDVLPLLKSIPCTKRTIYIIHASKESRERRVHERKRVPRARFGVEYVEKRATILEHNFTVIVEAIKELCTYKEVTNE